MSTPSLTEAGTKYYINGTLKECRKLKDKYINLYFNLGMVVLFVVFFGSILLYRYKGNISKEEIAIKNRKKKEYIISKLNQLGEIKKKNSMITDIPMWGNNPELSSLQR
tara:strand:- start:524 stop:850 length:327 start_codon:yes stop_codon:yes gene_type:complete